MDNVAVNRHAFGLGELIDIIYNYWDFVKKCPKFTIIHPWHFEVSSNTAQIIRILPQNVRVLFEFLYFAGFIQIDAGETTLPVCLNSTTSETIFPEFKIIFDRYEVQGLVSEKHNDVIYKAFDKSANEYAIIKLSKRNRFPFDFERYTLELLNSYFPNEPTILKVRNTFFYEGLNCLVLDYLENDLKIELSMTRGCLRSSAVREIISSILKSLENFHKIGIIHSNIKPSNIFFTNSECNAVKVVDYTRCIFGPQRRVIQPHSRFYTSPEMILELPVDCDNDIWALGCIAFELYTGEKLFPADDLFDLMACIMEMFGIPPKEMIIKSPVADRYFYGNGLPRYCWRAGRKIKAFPRERKRHMPGTVPIEKRFPEGSSLTFIDFVKRCLTWNERITSENALQHKWIVNLNNSEVSDEDHSESSSNEDEPLGAVNSTQEIDNLAEELSKMVLSDSPNGNGEVRRNLPPNRNAIATRNSRPSRYVDMDLPREPLTIFDTLY